MATSAFCSTTRRGTGTNTNGVPETPRSKRDPSPSGRGLHRRSSSMTDFSARYLSDCSSTSDYRSSLRRSLDIHGGRRSVCPSDSEVSSDEDEACVLVLNKALVPKLTNRKTNKCIAMWISEGMFCGMAEVTKFKGKYMKSMGINRDGRVLMHIEEIGYMLQREALSVLNGDFCMTVMDIYSRIMMGTHGCSWEAFKVYLELKNLGYIIGRHDVLWSNSCKKSKMIENSSMQVQKDLPNAFSALRVMDDCVLQANRCVDACGSTSSDPQKIPHQGFAAEIISIQQMQSDLPDSVTALNVKDDCLLQANCYADTCGSTSSDPQKIQPEGFVPEKNSIDHEYNFLGKDGASTTSSLLVFDVFSPNCNFKKTDPGTPDFSVCISSHAVPSRESLELLKNQNNGISVKVAVVNAGRVTFFQFDEVQLPLLP